MTPPLPYNQALESSVIVNHESRMSKRFEKAALVYDAHATIQKHAAKKLAELIKEKTPERILEIGCGTGHLTSQLSAKFPDAKILATDAAANMLRIARQNLSQQSGKISFQQFDPEVGKINGTFDLIIAGMVIHWFEDIEVTINHLRAQLKPEGAFYFSTIGQGCFPEWQAAVRQNNLQLGLRLPGQLLGILKEETKELTYESPLDFLQSLKQTGTTEPISGYTPLSPGELKRIIKSLAEQGNNSFTWHLIYGRMSDKDS